MSGFINEVNKTKGTIQKRGPKTAARSDQDLNSNNKDKEEQKGE